MKLNNKSLTEAFQKRYNSQESYDEENGKPIRENRSWRNIEKAKNIISGVDDVRAGVSEKNKDKIRSGLNQMGII